MRRRQWASVAVLMLAATLAIWWLRPAATTPSPGGYAGLGDTAQQGFTTARPGRELHFPADHGAHPDYRIEWWYLTANLETDDGRPFGVQWTLFRQALAPPGTPVDAKPAPSGSSSRPSPWSSHQLWMAHAALSTPQNHFAAERFARGMNLADTRGQAGVEANPFAAWLDDWALTARAPAVAGDSDGLERLRVNAAGKRFAYQLTLDAEGPLVEHGANGFSQKSADGQGSIYYSQPFYRVSGTVRVDGKRLTVHGRAWLDREWSSQLLSSSQQGWDWFSLHLDDGAKLMAFRLRGAGDAGRDYLSGSWIAADGEATPLDASSLALQPLETSEVAGRQLPIAWHIEIPTHQLDVTVRAVQNDQWMDTSFAYWEGMVEIDGNRSGVGYLEMTGY